MVVTGNKTDKITIKASKSHITEFLKVITKKLNEELIAYTSAHNDDDVTTKPPFWHSKWQSLLQSNLPSCTSRTGLSKLLFQNKNVKNARSMKACVDKLREWLPLNVYYDFDVSTRNRDVYVMTPKAETLADDDPQPSQKETVITKDDYTTEADSKQLADVMHGATSWKNVVSKGSTKLSEAKMTENNQKEDDKSVNSKNSYSLLEPRPDGSGNDDTGLSYDTMDDDDASTVYDEDDELSTTPKRSGSNINFTEINVQGNRSMISSVQSKDTSSGTDSSNAQKIILTTEENTTIDNAIKTNNVDTLDHELLIRWINSSSQDINDNLNKNMLSITKHGNNIKNEMNDKIRHTAKAITDLKNHCEKNIGNAKREVQKAVNGIKESEMDSIAAINTIANTEKSSFSELTSESKDLLQKLTNSVQMAQRAMSHLADINNATHTYTENIKEEMIQFCDTEKDEFIEWTAEKGGNYKLDVDLKMELECQLDLLQRERELMEKEREKTERVRLDMLLKLEKLDKLEELYNNKVPAHSQVPSKPLYCEPTGTTTSKPPLVPSSSTTQVKFPLRTKTPSTKTMSSVPGPNPVPSFINNIETAQKSLQKPKDTKPQPERIYYDNGRVHPLKVDTGVHYTAPLHDVHGIIMGYNPPQFRDGYWHHELCTINGTRLINCSEEHMIVTTDQLPASTKKAAFRGHQPATNTYDLTQDYELDDDMSTRPWQRRSTQRNQMRSNEFIYPIGTEPKYVHSSYLLKQAEKWDVSLQSMGIRKFYEYLKSRCATFNIFLKSYDDITLAENLAAITELNCNNYTVAYKEMTTALYLLLDQYKSSWFDEKSIAFQSLEAYTTSCDGFQYLKQLLKRQHPDLKDIRDSAVASKPRFDEYKDIYEFINAYIHWLDDERLRGRPFYSDKEKISHVINSLDDRFNTAKKYINERMNTIYLDRLNPKPMPEEFKLTPGLSVYIVDLLTPAEQQVDLTNDISDSSGAKINRAVTERKKYNLRSGRNNNNRNDRGSDSDRNPYTTHSRQRPNYDNDRNNKPKVIEKDLVWELLPDEKCDACGGINHNVYKTGCPTFARFANCKSFYDKYKDAEEFKPITKAYAKYQRTRQKDLRNARNTKRKTLRKMESECDSDSMAYLKKVYYDDYLEDFEDERFSENNPFDTLEDESDNESESV